MSPGPAPAPAPAIVQALVDNHRSFLAFLEPRMTSRADAEDLLQSAFVRALEKGGEVRQGESAAAWFYRLLRNALVDRQRSDAARGRALEGKREQDEVDADDGLLMAEACRCVVDILPTLKPEYGELLRRVDVREEPIGTAAEALGVTVNNARVRLHRARRALLRVVQRSCGTCADHGCLDCSCGRGGNGNEIGCNGS